MINSPVQLNVLLRNQRCQDYIRGKALISPRAPGLPAGCALGEPRGQVPTICPGSSAAQTAWARGQWQSKSLEVTLKTLSPCTRVPGAQAVGLMWRVTRTNGSVRRVPCPPHSNWPHAYTMFQWLQQKEKVLLHVVNLDPRPDIPLDPASAESLHLPQMSMEGQECLCKEKVYIWNGHIFQEKKRQPNPHTWHPSA